MTERLAREHACARGACTCPDDAGGTEAFAQDVLALLSRAIELKQLNAAELLLQCLEALAHEAPRTRGALDTAYMRIVRR